MYIQNNAKDKNGNPQEVIIKSFEGFVFIVPAGVSWIYDKAGNHILSIHKIEASGGKDRYGYDNGHGIPAIMEAKKLAWEKEGKQLVKVERFQVNPKYTFIENGNGTARTSQTSIDLIDGANNSLGYFYIVDIVNVQNLVKSVHGEAIARITGAGTAQTRHRVYGSWVNTAFASSKANPPSRAAP